MQGLSKAIQKNFSWAVVASELSHVFCCVIPTLVTVMTVLVNVGLLGALPVTLMNIHNILHDFEVPIIIFSAVMVVLGWGIHHIMFRVDCHDTGCVHPPCNPQKVRNSRILTFATVLLCFNLVIYFGIHRNILGLEVFESASSVHQHDDDSHHHDH